MSNAEPAKDHGAPYPEPLPDQKRYVIYLDKKENELTGYKLQLIPGRMEEVDGVNHYGVSATLETRVLEGWGYTYYVIKLGPTHGTLMMAFGESSVPRKRFVSASNMDLLSYNSKLPVVVYMPKDSELRYRIWVADETEGTVAKEG